MALDGDDMNRLIIEAAAGKEVPSIPGDEAKAFFEKMKKQAADIKAAGQSIDMLLN